MAVDYYTTGYSAFLSGTMNDQQVKQQHPLFRAGYNAAKKQAEQKTKTISDVRVQKVERAEKKPYELQWKDINTVMSFVPWNILSRKPELEVLRTAIFRSVEKRFAEIKCYGDIIDMVRQYWEALLEHGFKEGILNHDDLRKYNYVLKADRK